MWDCKTTLDQWRTVIQQELSFSSSSSSKIGSVRSAYVWLNQCFNQSLSKISIYFYGILKSNEEETNTGNSADPKSFNQLLAKTDTNFFTLYVNNLLM